MTTAEEDMPSLIRNLQHRRDTVVFAEPSGEGGAALVSEPGQLLLALLNQVRFEAHPILVPPTGLSFSDCRRGVPSEGRVRIFCMALSP